MLSNTRILFRIQAAVWILYVFFIFLYAFIGYKEEIPAFMIVLQFVFAICFFCSLYLVYRVKITISVLLVMVFCSSIILSFTLRQCYWAFTGTPFGLAKDVYTYSDAAFRASYRGFKAISDQYPHTDDYGFPVILSFIYTLTGDEYTGQYLALVFNALAVMLATYFLYKLMILLDINSFYIRFFSGFFGFFPYFSIVSATGMKENFFVFFILMSFYFMYKLKKTKKFFYLVVFVFSALVCYLFRSIVSIFLFLSFFILIISNYRNRRHVPAIIFIFLCIGLIFTIMLSKYILFLLNIDTDLSLVLKLRGDDLSGKGGYIVQVMAGLFGPFPNFSRANEFGIMYNSALLYKMILSFPLLMGLVFLLGEFKYKYYAIISYLLITIIVMILTGYSLHLRLMITCFPLILPIMAWSLQQRKVKNVTNYVYIIFSVGLIIAYHTR